MKWSKLSHVGLRRKNNEDNSCVLDELRLLAVADGMGGHKAGEVASKLALEGIESHMKGNPEILDSDPAEALRTAIQNANSKVFNYAQSDREKFRGMGTTITAALHRGDTVYIAHVGDSRAYLARGNEIRLLTVDHSLVNELLQNGGLTEEEAENHPHRNVLTRAIGTSPTVEVDVDSVSVNKGDIIILCTDGLSNLIDPEEIREMAGEKGTLADRAGHFVEKALDRGGDDNITVIIYEVE